jgi:hypothetical protein
MGFVQRGQQRFGAGPLSSSNAGQVEYQQATHTERNGLVGDGAGSVPLPGCCRDRSSGAQVQREDGTFRPGSGDGGQRGRAGDRFQADDDASDTGNGERLRIGGILDAGVEPQGEALGVEPGVEIPRGGTPLDRVQIGEVQVGVLEQLSIRPRDGERVAGGNERLVGGTVAGDGPDSPAIQQVENGEDVHACQR